MGNGERKERTRKREGKTGKKDSMSPGSICCFSVSGRNVALKRPTNASATSVAQRSTTSSSSSAFSLRSRKERLASSQQQLQVRSGAHGGNLGGFRSSLASNEKASRLCLCRGAVLDTDAEVSSSIKAAPVELIDENKVEYRTQINEMLYQLESRNPTQYPTTSPLLNGTWEFKYLAGIAPGPVPSPTREIALFMYAGGYTPGKFLFDLSNKLPSSLVDISGTKITISESQPRGKISANVKVFNNSFPVELRTSIEAESDVRMKEMYLDAEAIGRDITIPAQLRTERVFYITYLDEDLLISRDESGTPDVLYRVASSSSSSMPTSSSEDSEPPTAIEEEETVTPVEADATIEPTEGSEDEEGSGDSDPPTYTW